ncbi:MAG: hypothetical protein NC343_01905 [Muribaculum sp.]|nr:hypothetical protein [Muribaculaceae bacterium]MCM1080490.1 hypothetical protein [Muribaculum sp.]
MKIFAYMGAGNELEMIPDSSLVKDGKPFFVPGIADDSQWVYNIGIALRLSRLGKGIQPEFSMRYVDAATVCALPRAYGHTSLLDHCFDGAIIVGNWIELNSLPAQQPWQCTLSTGLELQFSPLAEFSALLEQISEWVSIKMGDILVPSTRVGAEALPEGYLFEASLQGQKCLSFRVK